MSDRETRSTACRPHTRWRWPSGAGQSQTAGASRLCAQRREPRFGGGQGLVFLAETEADLRAARGAVAVEAAARHAGDADIRHQMPRERDVVREAEGRDVRHDVVRALRRVTDESRVAQDAEQALA